METNLLSGVLSTLRRDTNDNGDSILSSRADSGSISVAAYIPGDATPEEIEAVRQAVESELARMRADAEAARDTERGGADDQ